MVWFNTYYHIQDFADKEIDNSNDLSLKKNIHKSKQEYAKYFESDSEKIVNLKLR